LTTENGKVLRSEIMDTWTELINGPMSSETLQIEKLFHEMIRSIPLIAVSAIAIFFGLMGLLTVLDYMFLKNKDLLRSNKVYKTKEQHKLPATMFLLSDTNAAV
jgi:hypothetical protein